MWSIDHRGATYSISVHKTTKPTWHFLWINIWNLYVCQPNEYGPARRIFTKISKIPFSILTEKGLLSVVYVDDSYLQGDDYEDCFSNVLNTIETFKYLGFTIHPEKSKFIPTQCIIYFEFILNFVQMTITLTLKKKEKILNLC